MKLPIIKPNEGTALAFQRELESMIDEMDKSLSYWITAAYRANKPATLATDASSASVLNAIMKRLTRKWAGKFSGKAKAMADYYALAAKDRTDAALKRALKKSGFAIEFKVTPEMQDIMTASVNENVSMIKTIATEHLADVNQLVQRSVQAGRDLGGLQTELKSRYGITRRRAQLIARQSNNNASAMMQRERARELGITEATWVHSNAGKHPRHEHVEWHGKLYDVSNGMWSAVSGKYVWPGSDFNCRCGSRMTMGTKVVIKESTKLRSIKSKAKK